jgi:hypothetical protein
MPWRVLRNVSAVAEQAAPISPMIFAMDNFGIDDALEPSEVVILRRDLDFNTFWKFPDMIGMDRSYRMNKRSEMSISYMMILMTM